MPMNVLSAALVFTLLRGAPAAPQSGAREPPAQPPEAPAKAKKADKKPKSAFRLGDDHPERLDLVDAGIGGIERARDLVEADLAFDRGLQIAAERVGACPP